MAKMTGKSTKTALAGAGTDQPLALSDLRPAPFNPRRISREAVKGLKASLCRFGDISGLVWNRRTGHLVCGHQRLAALREAHGEALRIEDGAVVTPDGERFPVRVVDWDDGIEKAANIAANHLLLQGEFVESRLAAVLSDLAQSNAADLGTLRLAALVEKLAEATTPPEVEFATELLLEHNYLVLYFDNVFDWQVCQDVFGLKQVKDLIPRKGQPIGTGRVLCGGPWLERFR